MIRLFTGLPGAGKTNHALSEAIAEIAKGRPVYLSNVNGLDLAGCIPFEDPRKWEELPAGSLLIVDEAQRFWRATRALDVPAEVQAMETHRHLGIDFILTTQQPNYLMKHLRGLVGEHIHHKRLAKGGAQTWKWNRVSEDPTSATDQELAESGMYVFNQSAFTVYKSTEADTHKPKLSKKLKFMIVGAILVGAVAIMLPGLLRKGPAKTANETTESEDPSAQPPGRGSDGSRDRKEDPPRTLAEYAEWLSPRMAGAMWSAPAFDKDVAAEPELYCASSDDGTDANGEWSKGGCSCMSEQGTRIVLDQQTCYAVVDAGGVYNPFRMPDQSGMFDTEQPGQEADTVDMPSASPVAVAPGAGNQAFGTLPGYGAHGLAGKGAGVGAAHGEPL